MELEEFQIPKKMVDCINLTILPLSMENAQKRFCFYSCFMLSWKKSNGRPTAGKVISQISTL